MINYPNKKSIDKVKNNIDSNSNQRVIRGSNKRGMDLENMINMSCQYYSDNDIAYIYKKPTPIKVNKVKTKNEFGMKKHVITEAYFSEKSTTDYSGLYRGYYIDFEAKQTKYKTFNIGANLHEHQIKHLRNISSNGGFAYLIVYFYQFDEVYMINFSKLDEEIKKGKSIVKIDFFIEQSKVVETGYNPMLDYIKIIDEDIFGKEKK